jgi:hypothetical protein
MKSTLGCTQQCLFSTFFEYETPKVVTVQNVPLGILRLLLQILVVSFVVFYQLWYARGYQEFTEVEASVTTKVKGFSRYRVYHGFRPEVGNSFCSRATLETNLVCTGQY